VLLFEQTTTGNGIGGLQEMRRKRAHKSEDAFSAPLDLKEHLRELVSSSESLETFLRVFVEVLYETRHMCRIECSDRQEHVVIDRRIVFHKEFGEECEAGDADGGQGRFFTADGGSSFRKSKDTIGTLFEIKDHYSCEEFHKWLRSLSRGVDVIDGSISGVGVIEVSARFWAISDKASVPNRLWRNVQAAILGVEVMTRMNARTKTPQIARRIYRESKTYATEYTEIASFIRLCERAVAYATVVVHCGLDVCQYPNIRRKTIEEFTTDYLLEIARSSAVVGNKAFHELRELCVDIRGVSEVLNYLNDKHAPLFLSK
jgi:hypothetical protein